MPIPHNIHAPDICGYKWKTPTTNVIDADHPDKAPEIHTCIIHNNEKHPFHHRCYCNKECEIL